MRAMRGPGHTLPRASTTRVTFASSAATILASASDEQGHLRVLREVHELADARRPVHNVDEVALRLPEEVHRHRARVDRHVPELLRRLQRLDWARYVLLLHDLREHGRHVRVVAAEL